MKKRFCFLTLLMVLLLLSGCRSAAQPEPEKPTPSAAPSPSPVVVEPEPEITDEPEPEPEPVDFFTAHGQPDLTAVSTGTVYGTALENGFYDSGISFDYYYSGPEVCGNTLYVNDYRTNDYTLYDVKTGRLLLTYHLPDSCSYGPLLDGGFWYAMTDGSPVYFVNASGIERCVHAYDPAMAGLNAPDSVSVSQNGRYVFLSYYDTDKPGFRYLDLEQALEYAYEDISGYPIVYYADDDVIFVGNSNYGFYLIHTVDGSAEALPESFSFDRLFDSIIGLNTYSSANTSLILSSFDEIDRRVIIPMTGGGTESTVSLASGFLITSAYDADRTTVRLYNLRTNVFTVSSLPAYSSVISVTSLDCGLLCMLCSQNDTGFVYLFNPAEATYSAFDPVIDTTTEQMAIELAELLDSFADEGIQIYAGSEGNDFFIDDYVGRAFLDETEIFAAVHKLTSILEKYPEGMLREAWEGSGRNGIKIYLCSTLYGVGYDGLATAGAVTSEVNNYIVMAFNCSSQDLSVDVPHEISHVFDRRIQNVSLYGEIDWMSVFENVTPHDYAYTYSDYYSLYRYTVGNEKKDSKVWYIDSYSRTFPTEDRARIMEHLFNATEEEPDEYLQYEHIRDKAMLYCYILRQCFTSISDYSVPVIWETGLPSIADYAASYDPAA